MDTGNTREEIDGKRFETARKLDSLTDERKEIISILRETIKGQLEELRRKDPYDADLSKSDKELAGMARRCNPLFTKITGEVHDCDKNDAKFAERLRIAAEAQDPDYWQKRYGRTAKERIEALEDILHNALVVECNMLALSCECERLNREEHERELQQAKGIALDKVGIALDKVAVNTEAIRETQAAHYKVSKSAAANAAISAGEKKTRRKKGKKIRRKQIKETKDERRLIRDEREKWVKRVVRKVKSNATSTRNAARIVCENAETNWKEKCPYKKGYLAKCAGFRIREKAK